MLDIGGADMASNDKSSRGEGTKRYALNQVEQFSIGLGPWKDEEGRVTLGWIVRLLEDALEEVKPNEQKAHAVWQTFDDLFGRRADYDFWRKMAAPAFWRQGKREDLQYFRPQATSCYPQCVSSRRMVQEILPEWEGLRDCPWTVKLGMVGALVDCVYQERREERRGHMGQRVVPLVGHSAVDESIGSTRLKSTFLEFVWDLGSKDICGAVEGALFLSYLGTATIFTPSDAEYIQNSLLPLIESALRWIDQEFDLYGKKKAVPYLHVSTIAKGDEMGHRLIPANWEDQQLILAQALARIADLLTPLLFIENAADREILRILRAQSTLKTAKARLYKKLRIQTENRAKSNNWEDAKSTIQFLRVREIGAFRDAAETATTSDLGFLAARLWQNYLWYKEAWIPNEQGPPDLSYRIVAEAGLRMNPKTRTPKRVEIPSRTLPSVQEGVK